jgi:choline kinase
MSDHLLSAGLLRRLALSSPADACRVAADRAHWPHEYVVESTRLAIAADGRITAIAKGLEPWDALDAGAFACTAEAWEAMDQAPEDCDLSTIFRILAARGRLFAADITGEPWHDIDTATDLAAAELALAAQHSALSARR